MSIISATSGTSIRFAFPRAGYDPDKKQVAELLTEGNLYTVDYINVGSYRSTVCLVEIPGVQFNSVHFEKVT